MKKYITEFIGTFFLVAAIGLTGIPLSIGATLMVMVYAGGHISGAHYNPAVTLAIFIRKGITMGDAMVYMGVQLLAAVAAVYTMSIFIEFPEVATQHLDTTKAIAAEAIGTFALAYVVLNVATAKANAGNSYFGLAIGFTVMAMAMCFGQYSGGAFNPAVAIAACVMKSFAWENLWIYLVACFGGAIIAGVIFNAINSPGDK
jgi:aquaporin Z